MNKAEQSKLWERVKARTGIDFAMTNLHLFDGYGLKEFKAVSVTLDDVADLVRWQCAVFNGTWDLVEFNSILKFSKTKFIIIG